VTIQHPSLQTQCGVNPVDVERDGACDEGEIACKLKSFMEDIELAESA
jgi:hypothetical protein